MASSFHTHGNNTSWMSSMNQASERVERCGRAPWAHIQPILPRPFTSIQGAKWLWITQDDGKAPCRTPSCTICTQRLIILYCTNHPHGVLYSPLLLLCHSSRRCASTSAYKVLACEAVRRRVKIDLLAFAMTWALLVSLHIQSGSLVPKSRSRGRFKSLGKFC